MKYKNSLRIYDYFKEIREMLVEKWKARRKWQQTKHN